MGAQSAFAVEGSSVLFSIHCACRLPSELGCATTGAGSIGTRRGDIDALSLLALGRAPLVLDPTAGEPNATPRLRGDGLEAARGDEAKGNEEIIRSMSATWAMREASQPAGSGEATGEEALAPALAMSVAT